MQYTKADQRSVYCSLSCRRVFSKPKNAALRKKRPIEEVVKNNNLSVSGFPRSKLVQILQYLLKQDVFESSIAARSVFPELFPQPVKRPEPPKILASAEQRDPVMEKTTGLLETLWKSGIYSDMILVSTERRYNAHRAVVCLQSPVISKSCTFNTTNTSRIKTNNFSNDDTTTVSFNFLDDDPQSVDCVVQYFYRSDYEIPRPTPGTDDEADVMFNEDADDSAADDATSDDATSDDATSDDSHLVIHVKVFTLAERYDIPPLKDLSLKKFEAAARLHWKSNYLVEAAREAYTSTISDVQEMRKAVIRILYMQRELLDEKHIKDLLLEVPQITFDLLMRFHDMAKPNSRSSMFGYR
ncbi:hypothetical protein NW759_016811 [Fusarium solani]|nr:hypothetical protein NW759_016811 [Fusarium solani]